MHAVQPDNDLLPYLGDGLTEAWKTQALEEDSLLKKQMHHVLSSSEDKA